MIPEERHFSAGAIPVDIHNQGYTVWTNARHTVSTRMQRYV